MPDRLPWHARRLPLPMALTLALVLGVVLWVLALFLTALVMNWAGLR